MLLMGPILWMEKLKHGEFNNLLVIATGSKWLHQDLHSSMLSYCASCVTDVLTHHILFIGSTTVHQNSCQNILTLPTWNSEIFPRSNSILGHSTASSLTPPHWLLIWIEINHQILLMFILCPLGGMAPIGVEIEAFMGATQWPGLLPPSQFLLTGLHCLFCWN